MTLIIAARCKDGIAIISDRKVDENGQVFTTEKVVFGPLAFYGGAGIGELLDKFISRITIKIRARAKKVVKTLKRENPRMKIDIDDTDPYEYSDEFLTDCEEELARMREQYKRLIMNTRQGLEVIIAFRKKRKCEIHYLDILNTLSSRRKSYACIGSGSQYAAIFLKELWHKNITIHEMGKLGQFIIEYVEKTGLDNNVGLGSDVYLMRDFDAAYYKRLKKLKDEPISVIAKDKIINSYGPFKGIRRKEWCSFSEQIKEFKFAFVKLAKKIDIRYVNKKH